MFAFLAGIDDLHSQNVFWHEGRPYLIDADNVLSRNQMLKVDNGDIDQTGFNRNTDVAAAANRNAIKNNDNTVINSQILERDAEQRRPASADRPGVAPGDHRQEGPGGADQDEQVGEPAEGRTATTTTIATGSSNDDSVRAILVRDGDRLRRRRRSGADRGVWREHRRAVYNGVAERAQQKKDLDAGVIPFYEYDFTSGRVTHNGQHMWNGLTVDQAIGALLDRFDPTGQSRQNAGL